ncbi:predicted protein [Naegleria gruberi]|uniref:Predicted protein n=1 Tax=Naegleria gruberi TaxID=5762 RepID=D2VFE9_NAEGR|nr:uncharacterized protein NAEGRDRAFT_49098 [Naegleria gruberi]EFC44451.1 predicted protein [Naegleria gruberi]|eukprot:XP_002677195.1 predicted protein [Naegleria gruberi strain NEG-M]
MRGFYKNVNNTLEGGSFKNRSSAQQQDETLSIKEFTRILKEKSRINNLSESEFEHYLGLFPSERYDNHIYNIIMSFYTKKCNYSKVEKTFEKIQHPDSFNLTELLKAYAYEGNVEKAEQIFSQIKYPDIHICNCMILLYSKQRSIGNVEKVVSLLRQKMAPNNYTYSLLLDAYFKVGDIEKAESTFQEAIQQSDNAQHKFIDTELVNALLSCFFNAGQYDKVEHYFNQYILGEKLEEFDSEKKKGIIKSPIGVIPNQRTIVTMLSTYHNTKDEQKFESLLKVMNYFGVKSNEFIDTKLVHHFFNARKYEQVIEVYNNIRKFKEKYHYIFIRYFVQSFAALDRVENLMMYIQELEQQQRINTRNLHNIIYALALVKKADLGEAFYRKYYDETMDNDGKLRICNSLLLCYIRSGCFDKAALFYSKFPVKPDRNTERILAEKFDRKKK